jgi:hypothetical protein
LQVRLLANNKSLFQIGKADRHIGVDL